MLLSIPDSAKVVAFKPEHPGLWSIKVGGLGFPGLGRPVHQTRYHLSPAWATGKLRASLIRCGHINRSKGSSTEEVYSALHK